MSYQVASDRCSAKGMKTCTAQRWTDSVAVYCAYGRELGRYLMWTAQSCQLKIKINQAGEIAIVHDVTPDFSGQKKVWPGANETTENFFQPVWIAKFNVAKCAETPGCTVNTGGCTCSITVEESVAFPSPPASRDDVIRECFIGGVDPSVAPEEYADLGSCNIPGIVKVYSKQGSSCSQLRSDDVFEYTDDFGITRFAKNMVSKAKIGDTYSLRTPVQFVSLVDPEERDTLHEFEAVLDSIFYHPNNPPFIAMNMLQRFGHSNPSPALISTVAWAYRNGDYMGIGSKKYGDLSALIAAILLHPESTSLTLLSDPTFGQVREPLVKVVSYMRSMEYQHDSPLYIPLLNNLQAVIRQGTFEQPSVFNYYLPEYSPPGPIGASGLVSPESMLLAGSAVTSLVDGMFRMTKNGLDQCLAGFATYGAGNCATTDGDTSSSLGALGFSNIQGTHDEVLDQVILTLTSNCLAADKRELIKQTTSSEFQSGDKRKATRAMMQLVASTPEFQTTSLAQNTAVPRPKKPVSGTASSDYKVVIFFFFAGGIDSYSILAPKGACHAQYAEARGPILAIPPEGLLDIDATKGTGQACDTFGVHNKFRLAKELHDAGELTFFANMGLLQFPVNKFNYTRTQSRLFSHNSQQYDLQRLDIKNVAGRTGVGGRLMDELAKLGFKTSSNTVSTHAHIAAGDPVVRNPTRQISVGVPESFNSNPTLRNLTSRVTRLNGKGSSTVRNNVFSETWSDEFSSALMELDEAEAIYANPAFNVTDFRPTPSGMDRPFQAVARYIKARTSRNVDREFFVVKDGGYDMHQCNCVGISLVPLMLHYVHLGKRCRHKDYGIRL